MSRAQLTSTVEQNSGGAVPPFLAGKNYVINGGMDIWQRGTTYTGTYGAVADRFFNGTDSTMTVSQQAFTPGNPISGYEPAYYLQIAKSSGGSYTDMSHSIEDVRTLAGQTFTFSFWGRVTSGTIGYGFGFNQNFGTGGSTQVAGPQPAFTLTTTWQRFTYTGTMPSISGKTIGPSSKVQIYGYCGTSAAVTIQLWGLQLEAGSVATPFTRTGATLQGELALAQRYFQQFNANTPLGNGEIRNSTTAYCIIKLAQTMRTPPTAAFNNPTAYYVNSAGKSGAAATIGLDISGTDFYGMAFTGLSGYTAGQSSYIGIGGAGNLQLSAEL